MIDLIPFLLLVELLCATYMSGVILFVQLVHYPSFLFVDESLYVDFQRDHMKMTSIVVLPMFIEMGVSLVLVFFTKSASLLHFFAFLLLLAIWLSTYFLSVPCHNSLKSQKSVLVIKRLVATNWPRAMLWPLRVILLSLVLVQVLNLLR